MSTTRTASGQASIMSDQASFSSTKNEKDEFCNDNYSELMSSLMQESKITVFILKIGQLLRLSGK